MAKCKHPKKTKYPSEGAAIKALKHMPPRVARHNIPYRCADHWHVGRMLKGTFK